VSDVDFSQGSPSYFRVFLHVSAMADHHSGADRTDETDDIPSQPPNRESQTHYDVREFGVVGDGDTDDTVPLQRAADAATPHGVLYVPAECHVRITEGVDIDLESEERNRFRVQFDGALKPEAGAHVHIHNGNSAIVDARVQGGSGDVDEDCAFRFTSLNSSWVNAWGENYPGTILRFDQADQKRGGVSTMSIGQVRSLECGRSVYMGPGPDDEEWGFMGGYGQVGDVWEHRPEKAFTAIQTNDLCIDQYENYVDEDNEQGVVFDDCHALWVDKMLVGGDASVPLTEVKNSDLFNFGELYACTNDTDALVFDSASRGRAQIHVGEANGVGLLVEDTSEHRDAGSLTFEVDITETADAGVEITDAVTEGRIELRGTLENCGLDDGAPTIAVQTDSRVLLEQMAVGDAVGPALRAGSDTHVLDCTFAEIDGTPATDRRL